MSQHERRGLSGAAGFGQIGGGLADESDLDTLLGRPEVREDLGLSAGQHDAVDRLLASHQEALVTAAAGLRAQPLREDVWVRELSSATEDRIRQVLTDDQLERLLRWRWRLLGARSLLDPDVRQRLRLSAEQHERISEIEAGMLRRRQEVQSSIASLRSLAAAQGQVEEKYSRPADELCLEVLDDAQKSLLRALTSEEPARDED